MTSLGLGCVQFGMKYGVNNFSDLPSLDEIQSIVDYASQAGIKVLDTAVNYGTSESRLGEIGVNDWDVVTKLPPVPEGCANVSSWVAATIKSSIEKMKVNELYGLLLHKPDDLLGKYGANIYSTLQEFKEKKLIKKIGISIYDPFELDSYINEYQLDIMQCPFNIVDRRLLTSGYLKKLNESGIEVHVRSVFLQGLLLMDKSERPKHFNKWSCLWNQWEQWLIEEDLSHVEACLSYVFSQKEIDNVIIGVDSLKQLKKIISSLNNKSYNFPDYLACNDQELINPSLW